MDAEDFDDDDVGLPSSFLPPADRLWRHPSELTALASGSMGASAVVEQHRPAWQVALLAGVAGAVAVAAVVMLTGGFTTRVVERSPLEQAGFLPVSGAPRTPVASADVLAGADAVRSSLGHLVSASGHVGSAVVVRADGHLVTDARVLGGDTTALVTLPDGRTLPAEVVGVDDGSGLAVLRVDTDGLAPAALGSAADLQAGEPAIAIGAPASRAGRPSATVGVIKSLGVEVVASDGTIRRDLVSTDAPLGAGSAGGVLLDRRGAVVGITTAVPADLSQQASDAPRVAFALPIDIARAVADDLIDLGVVRRAWLGIVGSDVDREASARTGASQGALVHELTAISAAGDGGVVVGDVVVAWDGRPVRSMSQLVIRLRAHHPGDAVTLAVVRDGERHELTTTLGDAETDGAAEAEAEADAEAESGAAAAPGDTTGGEADDATGAGGGAGPAGDAVSASAGG